MERIACGERTAGTGGEFLGADGAAGRRATGISRLELLSGAETLLDHPADTESAALRQNGRELLFGKFGGAIIRTSIAFPGRPENLAQQQRFELFGGVLDPARTSRVRGRDGGSKKGGVRDWRHDQITSISASRAFARRRFCRIAMTSRGVEPILARARTS